MLSAAPGRDSVRRLKVLKIQRSIRYFGEWFPNILAKLGSQNFTPVYRDNKGEIASIGAFSSQCPGVLHRQVKGMGKGAVAIR